MAVGLVSLGIQVCGGINTYLDAIKCRADDIASVHRQAQNFESVLRVIQRALVRVDASHQASITVVAECFKSCETELQSLEGFVSELTSTGTSQPNFKDKIKETTKKLVYAFDRPKLDQLETRLHRVNGIFQTALQALGLDISSSANEVLGTIESSSHAISSDLLVVRSELALLNGPLVQVNDSLPSIQRSVDSLPSLLSLKTDSISSEVRVGTESLRDDLHHLQSSLQSSSKSGRVQLNHIEQLLQNSKTIPSPRQH